MDIPPQVAITFNDVQLTTLSNARMGGAQSTLTAYSCTATGNAACPPEGTGADNLKWNTAPAGAYGYYAFAPGMIRGLPAGASITYRYTVVTNSDGATCGGAIGLTDLLRDALVYGAGALGTFPFTDANGIIESPSSVSTPMNPPRTCKLAPAWFSTSKVLIGDTGSIDTEGEVKTYRFTVTRGRRLESRSERQSKVQSSIRSVNCAGRQVERNPRRERQRHCRAPIAQLPPPASRHTTFSFAERAAVNSVQ